MHGTVGAVAPLFDQNILSKINKFYLFLSQTCLFIDQRRVNFGDLPCAVVEPCNFESSDGNIITIADNNCLEHTRNNYLFILVFFSKLVTSYLSCLLMYCESHIRLSYIFLKSILIEYHTFTI